MGDPLSIAGSAAGLLSPGIQVMQSLVDFYTLYKDQDSELAGTIEKLDSLLVILESLEKALSNRKFQVDERSLIKNIETSIENCDELIHELRLIARNSTNPLLKGSKQSSKSQGTELYIFFGRASYKNLTKTSVKYVATFPLQ